MNRVLKEMYRSTMEVAKATAIFIAMGIVMLSPYAQAFSPTSKALFTSRRSRMAPEASMRSIPRSGATRTAHTRGMIMKVAATQPQPEWQSLKTRDIFNALSQGEIGKRDFTAALAKRMVSKAMGMQREYELQNEAISVAASSSAVVTASDLGETRQVPNPKPSFDDRMKCCDYGVNF